MRRDKECTEVMFQEILAGNFLELLIVTNQQLQENHTPILHYSQLPNSKDKEMTPEIAIVKKITYRGTIIGMTADF